MSRIRQIKPSWFLDKELRRGTTADCREFYVGLWMLADDDGWLVWDLERIAAELYPYDGVARRERLVGQWATALEMLNTASPHLVIYDCGHAVVPKMKAHQRIAGTRATSVSTAHRNTCRDIRSRVSLDEATRSPVLGRVVVGNGTERKGTPRAGEPDGPRSEFQQRVPRPA